MKKILYCAILISLVFMQTPGSRTWSAENQSRIVRVCIIDDKDNIHLTIRGPYRMTALGTEKVIWDGDYISCRVSPDKKGFKMGTRVVNVPSVKIMASEDSSVYVDGRRFRGDIDIIRKDNMQFRVVNDVDVEEYLYGVLYHEVSHKWPDEVLKAQAIAARTFAIYQARQNKTQEYDLRSDIYSQVYGGRTSEKWSTTEAVDETRGKILVYGGDILPAYYHATCAGHTEDASNLWKVDMPPLKGVECNYCKKSPHYKWSREMPLSRLAGVLRDNGYNMGDIDSVTVLSRNGSGRVDKIEIKDTANTAVILTGKDFRQMIGPNTVRSAKFEVSIKSGTLAIKGSGWGHGVGMCQWGALGLAEQGKTAEEILSFYYPGAEITTIDKVKDKL
jgi:stage II sporulation protein D